MNTEDFNKIIHEQISRCENTLCKKADEYATEDRLHNFKVAAGLQDCLPTTALAGMMAKHTVSVYDMIRGLEEGKSYPQELWDEKIGDSINYLLLLAAAVREKAEKCPNVDETFIVNAEPGEILPCFKRRLLNLAERSACNMRGRFNGVRYDAIYNKAIGRADIIML